VVNTSEKHFNPGSNALAAYDSHGPVPERYFCEFTKITSQRFVYPEFFTGRDNDTGIFLRRKKAKQNQPT
jgi:hypothetical protein